MTIFTPSPGLSLTGFTASDLPAKKWMKLICPKMRLRVRARKCDSVSSSVKVYDRGPNGMNLATVHWPWSDDGRPFLLDDENFEIEIERRFLLRYKCIRRTKRTSIDQLVRTRDHCEMSLYDGQMSAEQLEDSNRVEMGQITFTLQSDASKDDVSSADEANASTCSTKVNLCKEQKHRMFWRR